METRTKLRAAVLTFAFASVGSASAFSCTLTTSLDGLTGGIRDGGASSDVIGATDSKTVDASADGYVPFCQANPGHSFCADFDESPTVPTFDSLSDKDNDFSIDTSTSTSPPQSFLAVLSPTGPQDQAVLKKTLPSGQTAHVAFDFRLDASIGDVLIFYFYVPATTGISVHGFYLETYAQNPHFTEIIAPDDGGASTFHGTALTASLVDGAWNHLDFTVNGKTGALTVTYNTAVFSRTIDNTFPKGAFSLQLMLQPNQSPSSVQVHFDNIVADIE